MINTIALKECRQAVRSRLVTGMLLFLVIAELAACLITLVVQAANSHDYSLQGGRVLFVILLMVLTYGASAFVPVYTMLRLMAERWNDSVDLLYVTGMSPWAIVRGKLVSAGAVLMLLFSAVMPFMALTYPLRGIDIFSMLAVLAFAAVCIMLFTLFMLLVGSAGTTRPHKVVNALAGIFFALVMAGSLTAFGVTALEEGLASILSQREALLGVVMAGVIGLALAAVMYVATAMQLMPPSANRALPLRLVVTGAIVVFEVVALAVSSVLGDADALMTALRVSMWMICISIIYVSAAPREISLRVRREIPRSRIGQLVYPLYEGAGAGFLWTMLLMCGVCGSTLTGAAIGGYGLDDEDALWRIVIMYVYVLSAGLVARSVWMYFLPRRVPSRYVALTGVVVLVMGTAAPLLAGLWYDMRSLPNYGLWWYGNVAAVFDSSRDAVSLTKQGLGAGVGLAGAVLISIPWWYRELRAFRPLERRHAARAAHAAHGE